MPRPGSRGSCRGQRPALVPLLLLLCLPCPHCTPSSIIIPLCLHWRAILQVLPREAFPRAHPRPCWPRLPAPVKPGHLLWPGSHPGPGRFSQKPPKSTGAVQEAQLLQRTRRPVPTQHPPSRGPDPRGAEAGAAVGVGMGVGTESEPAELQSKLRPATSCADPRAPPHSRPRDQGRTGPSEDRSRGQKKATTHVSGESPRSRPRGSWTYPRLPVSPAGVGHNDTCPRGRAWPGLLPAAKGGPQPDHRPGPARGWRASGGHRALGFIGAVGGSLSRPLCCPSHLRPHAPQRRTRAGPALWWAGRHEAGLPRILPRAELPTRPTWPGPGCPPHCLWTGPLGTPRKSGPKAPGAPRPRGPNLPHRWPASDELFPEGFGHPKTDGLLFQGAGPH